MSSTIIIYITVLLSSIFLSFFIRKAFIKLNIVDIINHRSSHKVDATRSAGSVIFFILFFYTLTLYFSNTQPYDFSILVPISILYVTGLYDDIYGVDFGLKFIFQIITAKILVDMGYVIDVFSIFGLEFIFSRTLTQIVTIVSYVGIFNAYNFIDGIDLNVILESIKNILIILFLFNFSIAINQLIFITLIVLISLVPFNLSNKMKVFMGDSGSLILPILILFFLNQGISLNDDQNILKYLLIIFIYPIIDLIRVIIIRLKNNKSPFKADRNHIHHFIDNKLNSHIKSSSIIFIITLFIQLALITIFL